MNIKCLAYCPPNWCTAYGTKCLIGGILEKCSFDASNASDKDKEIVQKNDFEKEVKDEEGKDQDKS